MKLAPLVPKPKPGVVGSPALLRKPKVTAATFREPEADEGDSFEDEPSEGERPVSILVEHRGPLRTAEWRSRLSDRTSNGVARREDQRAYLELQVKAHLSSGKYEETFEAWEAWDEKHHRNTPFTMMTPIEQGAKLNHLEPADLIGSVDESIIRWLGSRRHDGRRIGRGSRASPGPA